MYKITGKNWHLLHLCLQSWIQCISLFIYVSQQCLEFTIMWSYTSLSNLLSSFISFRISIWLFWIVSSSLLKFSCYIMYSWTILHLKKFYLNSSNLPVDMFLKVLFFLIFIPFLLISPFLFFTVISDGADEHGKHEFEGLDVIIFLRRICFYFCLR